MTRPRTRTKHTAALIDLLRAQPRTRRDLLAALGIPTATLTRLLGDLRDEGYGILSYRKGPAWLYRLEQEPDKDR